MSANNYRTVPERVVISTPLIKQALQKDFRTYVNPDDFQDQKELESAEKAARESAEAYDLDQLPRLRLSYENICEIDNLEGFDTLTHLSLDNNVIKEIVNLDHLTRLVWLDLSFNNITKIQGLDSLVSLRDLTLCNNRITTIEGLDKNTSIQCLSLGNNKVKNLENIGYLRSFPVLQMLNLMGNPVSKEDEYRQYVISHVEQLHYLDYSLITDPERIQARETFQDELMILAEKEAIEQVTRDKKRVAEEEMQLLKEANLTVVRDMFSDLMDEDTEIGKLKVLPGVEEMLEDYAEQVNEASEEFKAAGMGQYERRNRELQEFRVAVVRFRANAADAARNEVEAFEHKKKKCFMEIQSRDDPDLQPLMDLREQLHGVGDKLLAIENSLLDTLDKAGNELDGQLSQIKAENLEFHNTFFRAVESFESVFNEQLSELVADLAEKYANEELEHLSEDALDLLGDKEVVDTAVQGSNDIHIGKLLAREDELRANEVAMFQTHIQSFKKQKFEENRARISEIYEWKMGEKQEIETLLREEREIAERDY